MYEDFTQERIAKLRLQKGVSARDMSLSLGQNSSYINQIENKMALPSLQGFFYICDYFGISPGEFFEEENQNPARIKKVAEEAKKLDDTELEHILSLMMDLNGKRP